MTGEGREYGRRNREGSDEDSETDRIVREIIDEIRREQENEESPEPVEAPEQVYDAERVVRETIEEIQQEEAERLKLEGQKESKKEPQETKEKVEPRDEWDVDECVRQVIEEVQQEEAERQRLREEREHAKMEKEEQLEASFESRKETADNDELDEYEEKIREAFEEHGIDPEEVKERWRKRFEEEVQDELGEQSEKQTAGEEDKSAGSERTAEGRYYYDDGSGQVYEVQMDSKESSGSETESRNEVEEVHEEPPTEHREKTESKIDSGEFEPEKVTPTQETGAVVEEKSKKEVRPEQEELPKVETEEVKQEKEATINESTETSSEECSEGTSEDSISPEKSEETSNSTLETNTKQTEEHIESEGSQDTEENVEETGESREKEIWNEYEVEYGSLEDENYKSALREVMDQLPEEVQEEFNESVREKVQTVEDFEELARKHGLDELLEDKEVMDEIRNYLKVRSTLEQEPDTDIEKLAEDMGIDAEMVEEWSRGESEPYSLKKLLNLEAFYMLDEIIRHHREQNFPESKEELEEILETGSEFRTDRFFELERDEAIAYVIIMAMRRRGEIERKIWNGREVYSRKQIMELSKIYGISTWEIISWLRGEKVSSLIMKIRGRNQIGRKGKQILKSEKQRPKRGQRGTYQINIVIPIINGVRVHSYDQFLDVLKQEKPALLHRKDIKKLLRFCEVFFDIIQEFETQTTIHSYDISSISKRAGLSKTTIREWLTEGFVPKLIYLISKVPIGRFSQISLLSRVTELEKKTKGIVTEEIMLERLGTLYIENEIKQTKKSLKDSSDFFSVISSVQNGAISIEQVAENCHLHEDKVQSILYGLHIPRLVNLVSSVPTDSLPSGWKWIPIVLIGTKMKQFIKVPVKINSQNDLQIVLDQMKALNTPRMSKLEMQFGDVSPIQSFLYYLGLTISDGNFDISKKGVLASARMKLKLAKKYHWSINAGNAYCHALERIGLGTKKGKDELKVRDDGTSSLMHQWRSVASPFFIWVKKTLLGLNPNEIKNNNRIRVDWILDMPQEWRISLLQGITDGDASASFQGQFLQVHTYTNQAFYKQLLTSLGIESYSCTNSVGISEKKSICLAEKLPMFRHASSRQENISKLLQMLASHNWSRITPEEEKFILDLHKQGFRVGIIIEKLWDRFGRTRRRGTIYELIKRKIRDSEYNKKEEG